MQTVFYTVEDPERNRVYELEVFYSAGRRIPASMDGPAESGVDVESFTVQEIRFLTGDGEVLADVGVGDLPQWLRVACKRRVEAIADRAAIYDACVRDRGRYLPSNAY